MPPSTRNVDAVMNDASSLARNATAAASSSGSANRPIGTCTSRRCRPLGILGEQLLQQRGVHRSGAQRVDPDALPGELHAELARHRQHAALGCGVGDLRRRRAHHRDERRGVDDRALLLRAPCAAARPAAQVHRLEVDVLHPVPRVELGGLDRVVVRRRDARVVERDVDRAVGLGRGVEQRVDRRPRRRRRPARRVPLELVGGGLAGRRVDVADDDVGALGRATACAVARPMPLAPPVMTATLPASRWVRSIGHVSSLRSRRRRSWSR